MCQLYDEPLTDLPGPVIDQVIDWNALPGTLRKRWGRSLALEMADQMFPLTQRMDGPGSYYVGPRWQNLFYRPQDKVLRVARHLRRRGLYCAGHLNGARGGPVRLLLGASAELGGYVAESHCAVITTTDSAEAAEELGRGIVEARLGACVQIVGPIRSLYRWEGGVQNDQEWQCWVKTSSDRLDALTEHIKKNHSYDVPEVVALPIVGGSRDYLSWITEETRPG